MRKILFVLAALITLGCASSGAARTEERTPVVVVNDNWQDVTIYYNTRGFEGRLGRITALSTEKLYIRNIGPEVSFKVVEFASHKTVWLPRTLISQGSGIEIRIRTLMTTSSIITTSN